MVIGGVMMGNEDDDDDIDDCVDGGRGEGSDGGGEIIVDPAMTPC